MREIKKKVKMRKKMIMPKHWPFLSKQASKDATAPGPTAQRGSISPKYTTVAIEKFIPQKPQAIWGTKGAFCSFDRCAGTSEGTLYVFSSY